MSRIRNYAKDDSIIKWYERNSHTIDLIVDFLLILITIIGTLLSFSNIKSCILKYFIVLISIFIVCVKLISILKQLLAKREYNRIRKTEELSVATLKALKSASATKSRYILQSIYGRVPEWHPVDYTKNILVYDVHEQIRSILFSMQKLIIDTTDGLNEDQVTVDLVYRYTYKEDLPNKSKSDKEEKPTWRIITSGNHSLGGSMQAFLEDEHSFFYHVYKQGYVFYNDKMDCIRDGHYIVSGKDRERDSAGSVIGLKIEVRNDEPETIFINGMLTIATYGRRLCEGHDRAIEDYEEIFRENVLNSFKSLIASELSQMFIRHAITHGDMCPKTGKLHVKEKSIRSKSDSTCLWTGKPCHFKDQ